MSVVIYPGMRGDTRNAFARYRQDILGMVSDAEILTKAGEGDMRNLWKMRLDSIALRKHLSKHIGEIERESTGGVNPPEWCVAPHNLLVEVFAKTIESQPCPATL